MDALIADTVADARWFPLRFDARHDAFHFAWIPAELHAELTFLSTLRPPGNELRIVPRAAIAEASFAQAPLHFILHSGLGGSTLLATALAQPAVVTTLKEPPVLTDLVAFGLSAPSRQTAVLREQVTRLLARPFAPGQSVVIKMSSVGNGLVTDMAASRPDSRVLCLRTELESMLASLAKAGLEGRLNARKFLIGLRNSGFAELGYDAKDLLEQTDLQLASLGWLAIQRLSQAAAARLGSERVRSIASDRLLGDPRAALTAIGGHFRLKLDVEERLASGIFDRHAKTGKPFGDSERRELLAQSMEVHGAEIRPIVDWARKVAEVNRIAWEAPNPLPG
jgi:hypothetical protein